MLSKPRKVVTIRNFQVLQLDPASAYADLQLGSLRLLLGHLEDAAACFRRVISRCGANDDSPLLVPALKGLSEMMLASAREALVDFVDERAKMCCEEALKVR